MAHDGSLIFDTKIDASGFTSGIGKLGKVATKSIGAVTAAIGAAGTALAGLGGAAIRAGINFESAFAGVKKTVNGTEQELAQLREGILDLAGEMPMAADAIAGIAESAGQLGIEKENLLGFTKTMADLGVATNLAGEEAASTLAKFANITGMDQGNFDRLGSAIVALGNNLATTEADIAAMAMRLAGTGKQIGLSEAQILSFAGALSSVGIEAEAGGTAFSKVFKDMQLAVETGNADLKNFATVAGMSAAEFKSAFQKDAAGAILSFIDGLGKSEERGMSVVKVLNDLGITEVRMSDALSRASGAADLFANALELGSSAWAENTALTAEAEQRYATMESRLAILKNRVTELGITFYESTNTDIGGAVDLLGEYVGEIQAAFESDGLTGAVDALGDILGDLAVRLVESAPGILEAGAGLIEKLADSLIENADVIGESAAKLGVLLVKTIQKFIPKIADLAGEILKGFAKGLGDAIPILKPFTAALELVGNNLKTLTTITVAYITATKGMQIVSKVSGFLKAASVAAADYTRAVVTNSNAQLLLAGNMKLSTAVVGVLSGKMPILTAAKALCTKAQLALNAAWAANPVGVVVAAVAALAAGIAILYSACNRETDAQKKLRAEMEADIQTMQKNTEAIREGIDAYHQSVQASEAQAEVDVMLLDNTEALYEELIALADANGRVQDADRARANYILGELNKALGTEYEMTGGVIEQYDKLIAKTQELIKAKQAQAVADSYFEEYQAGVKLQAEKEDEATQNAELLAEKRRQIAEAEKEARQLVEQNLSLEAAMKMSQIEVIELANEMNLGLSDSAKVVAETYDTMQTEIADAQKKVQEYADISKKTAENEARYSTACTEIQLGNYDAVIVGRKRSAEEIQALARKDKNVLVAEMMETSLEIQELETQKNKARTDAERQLWQQRIDDSKNYGKLLVEAYNESGGKAEEGIAKNLRGMGDEGGKQLAEAIVASLNGAPLDISALVEGLKASAEEHQADFSALGLDFAAGYAQEICSPGAKVKVQQAVFTLVQAALNAGKEAQDSNSPSKETGYLGDDFVNGYANAISGGAKKASAAAEQIAEAGLTSIQETQDSHSAAKETRYLGNDFSDGFVAGIADGVARAEAAAEKLAESTLNAIKRFVPEGTAFAIDFTEWELSDEGKHALEQLKLQLDIGLITQKEYYRQLEYWRNGYLKKGTQDWWNYTIELAEGQEKLAKDEQTSLKNRLSAGLISEAEYYVELERIRDEYLEEGSEAWQGYTDDITEHHKEAFTDIAKEAEKSIDGVIKLQESMEKKLQSVTKAPYDEQKIQVKTKDKKGNEETLSYTKRALHDYAADNETLSTYKDAILAVKERGVPTELLDVLRDMSVEDGMAFAKLLTEASDEEFAAYIKEWQENQDLSGAIARELYSEETDEAINSFATALKEAGKQVPEGFFDNGKTAADKFGEGFIEQIETVFTKIKGAFSRSLSVLTPFQLGGLTGVPFYGGNTNNFNSTVYVSAASPAEAERIKKDTTITNTLGGN